MSEYFVSSFSSSFPNPFDLLCYFYLQLKFINQFLYLLEMGIRCSILTPLQMEYIRFCNCTKQSRWYSTSSCEFIVTWKMFKIAVDCPNFIGNCCIMVIWQAYLSLEVFTVIFGRAKVAISFSWKVLWTDSAARNDNSQTLIENSKQLTVLLMHFNVCISKSTNDGPYRQLYLMKPIFHLKNCYYKMHARHLNFAKF